MNFLLILPKSYCGMIRSAKETEFLETQKFLLVLMGVSCTAKLKCHKVRVSFTVER